MSSAGESSRPARAPDWAAVEEQIVCPLCDYNLRGLIEPRCPECGYRFEWPDVLDPRRRVHPYLFEHHPERNCWSFWRTQAGAVVPRRFWRTLHPAQPSRARRVVLYWLISASLVIFAVGVPLVRSITDHHRVVLAQRQNFAQFHQSLPPDLLRNMISPHRSIDAYLDAHYPLLPNPAFLAGLDYGGPVRSAVQLAGIYLAGRG